MTDRPPVSGEPEMVEVRWLDSVGFDGWDTLDAHWSRLIADGMEHLTIGWAVQEDDRYLMIASSRQVSTGQEAWNGVMVIPQVAVVKRRNLSLGEARVIPSDSWRDSGNRGAAEVAARLAARPVEEEPR